MNKRRARLTAAGLVLIAMWEVSVLVSARHGAATAENWRAVAAVLPARLRDDQLIVFAPRWIDPVGRQWLGDRMTLDHVARMDTARFREIWEVSVRGATAPELADEPAVSEQSFGPILVRRFVRDAPAVTWRLTDATRICEIDFEPRRGTVLPLLHPFAQAVRRLPGVNLGNQLQVYAGLDDYKKRSANRSRAAVQILVDGREVTRGIVGNDDGWVALPLAATPSGPHDVDVVARVHDPHGNVDVSVCIAAEARSRQP